MTKEPQIMICPNWKTCTYRVNVQNIPEDEGRYNAPTFWHCDKHPFNLSCKKHKAHGKWPCPACIPYETEPQPATCPCWHEYGESFYDCQNNTCGHSPYKRDADLQPEKQCTKGLTLPCDVCDVPEIDDDGNCKCWQPISQMPLRVGTQIQPESWVFSKEALKAHDSAIAAQAVKPMIEALKEARKDLEIIQGGEGPYNRDPLKHLENCYEHMIETAGKSIAKIDAVLPKGEGK